MNSDQLQHEPNAGYAWLVAVILLLFSMAGPLNQFKVPPIMPILIKALGLSAGNAGWLMSVFSILSFLLALPAGFIFQRFGYRKTGIVAICPIIIGAVMGALSTSPGLMMASRVLEGIGYGFMGVLAPAVIAMWFPPERRGAPMGVWSSWVPLGSTVMMLAAPALANSFGWQSVWWTSAVYSLVIGILFLTIVKLPSTTASQQTGTAEPAGGLGQILKNGRLWALSFTFLCFNFTLLTFSTWAPTFLSTVRYTPLGTSSFLTSIPLIISIFTIPLCGVVSDRLGTRKCFFVSGTAFFGILSFLAATMGQSAFVPVVILMGIFLGFCVSPVFASAIDLVGDQRLASMAMGMIGLGNYGGFMAGPLVFGSLLQSTGSWALAFIVCGLVSVAGAIVGLFTGVK